MNSYDIDLDVNFFILNDKKYFFSSADKIEIRIDLGHPNFFIKQTNTLTRRVNEIKINPKLAEKLINKAYLQINVVENFKIENLNKYPFLSNDCIEIDVKNDLVQFLIRRPTNYIPLSNEVAQYLINCVHLKVHFQDAFSVQI